MRSGIPVSASASSRTGWRRRYGAIYRALGNERASAGRGGVDHGCTKPWDSSMDTGFSGHGRKSLWQDRFIDLDAKQTGERSAGNLHAAFDVAGTENVAWSRYCDTRRRKGEKTREHKLRPTPARQSSTLPMSEDGKRSVAKWPKLPRLSSTLPQHFGLSLRLSETGYQARQPAANDPRRTKMC